VRFDERLLLRTAIAMKPQKCSECGAEFRLGPDSCPLCGADRERTADPQPGDQESYHSNVRQLREELQRLREGDAEAV
jgi:uncharacterized Zn finger protein (UPF0148 family)